MNIYLEPGTTNAFILSMESPGEGYEYIGEVSDDISLTPVIPGAIYDVIGAFSQELLSTGFEISIR
ncbi:hypothetical protein PAG80_19095 [Klebsiella quasipneumoniae]|uniref:hypothetical protein n=1 Tax=Klebsiella quasipneumoniae TaxID=1463165 RepID=UPI000A2E595B|nr:hypothetical protein [Klebsiella quasipneumoniae]HCM4297440.1 hypothetical protein [Klebsiella quasipneumoniae subsp. quasipneumoniae]MDR4697940.1 hypothetical protein [Klebsiella quasipneumoniae]MDR4800146.1 hypothetical protein [Klebsiella quasipneumoniae]MDR4838754.1 hypothetical protein [Klebsiella quasipneumoniae]MDR4875269.1 hypothetical protein [Klebsiella quasipneumoniae]